MSIDSKHSQPRLSNPTPEWDWKNRNKSPKYTARRIGVALVGLCTVAGLSYGATIVGENMPGVKSAHGFPVSDGETASQFKTDMCEAVSAVNGSPDGCEKLAEEYSSVAINTANNKDGVTVVSVASVVQEFGGEKKTVVHILPAKS